jgi:hypothetical protein
MDAGHSTLILAPDVYLSQPQTAELGPTIPHGIMKLAVIFSVPMTTSPGFAWRWRSADHKKNRLTLSFFIGTALRMPSVAATRSRLGPIEQNATNQGNAGSRVNNELRSGALYVRAHEAPHLAVGEHDFDVLCRGQLYTPIAVPRHAYRIPGLECRL